MDPIEALRAFWTTLASLKLTILFLSLLMALVVACTLAQVHLGTYGAVKLYMRSLLVYWPGTRIPVFPGGGLVGLLLLGNLVAAQFSRLELGWGKAGLWLVHLGLILIFLGEFVTGLFQVETQMAIDEGATLGYTESLRETELALIDETGSVYDQVYAVPEHVLARRRSIIHPGLPFTLEVKRFYQNAALARRGAVDLLSPLVTAGIGTGISVREEPPVTADDQRNQVAAILDLKDGLRSLGTWLVSNGLGSPQRLSWKGQDFVLVLRPVRHYLPFTLTLKKFRHDLYPGTDIPRNFSSLVRLRDPARGEDRDALISMNNPLRYGGRAFYQASFGKNDTLSVLQVVENPGWVLPYLSCALVALGLLVHFIRALMPARGGDPR
jgi:hypothetical protein